MSGASGPASLTSVPFVDLEREHAPLREKLSAAMENMLERGDFILGEALEQFERQFSAYLGVEYSIGIGSGTAALTIALRAAGIGRGDEVLVPAHTYIASALGVVHSGATPVFCDVGAETGLIDLGSAESQVTERTAAVLAVHLYGQACDMDAVQLFADRRGLAVLEDAAQAHGGAWDGRKLGSFGLASAFSFFPSKNLGALGDGGMVCTNDPEVAASTRCYRNLGQRAKGEHLIAGYNERLDTLQAAFLSVKLRMLDEWNDSRRAAATWYRDHLPPGLGALAERPGARDVYHLFPVRVAGRDDVAKKLAKVGVQTGIHYPAAVHHQPPFSGHTEAFPVSEDWARDELSLPMFAYLTESEVQRTCDVLRHACGLSGAVEERAG